jgi:hypothetical protein
MDATGIVGLESLVARLNESGEITGASSTIVGRSLGAGSRRTAAMLPSRTTTAPGSSLPSTTSRPRTAKSADCCAIGLEADGEVIGWSMGHSGWGRREKPRQRNSGPADFARAQYESKRSTEILPSLRVVITTREGNAFRERGQAKRLGD